MNNDERKNMTNFRPMRRLRQQLTEDESREVLQRCKSGVLCLSGDEGYPYGVPMSYVLSGNNIYFHSAMQGHKVDAVRRNDKASFTVVDTDEVKPAELTDYFRSVICFGRVQMVEEESEKLSALRKLGERYSPDYRDKAEKEISQAFPHVLILRLSIDHITGKEAIELRRKEGKR